MLYGALGIERILLHRYPKRSTVMMLVTKDFRPGVTVRIEMHKAERTTMFACQCLQNRQGDRMIAARTDRHDPGRHHFVIMRLDIGNRPVELVNTFDGHITQIRHSPASPPSVRLLRNTIASPSGFHAGATLLGSTSTSAVLGRVSAVTAEPSALTLKISQ